MSRFHFDGLNQYTNAYQGIGNTNLQKMHLDLRWCKGLAGKYQQNSFRSLRKESLSQFRCCRLQLQCFMLNPVIPQCQESWSLPTPLFPSHCCPNTHMQRCTLSFSYSDCMLVKYVKKEHNGFELVDTSIYFKIKRNELLQELIQNKSCIDFNNNGIL